MSKLFFLSLYYISFAPLWLSVVFIDLKSCFENTKNIWTEKISIGCIIIFSIICLIILLVELHTSDDEKSVPQVLKEAKEEKNITAEYLLSYILPLFAFDFTTWNGVILFLIFFFSIGFLCVKHNYFSVNIALELANFRFYTCILKNEDGVETEQTIISRCRLTGNIGEEIYLKSINNEFKFDLRNNSHNG